MAYPRKKGPTFLPSWEQIQEMIVPFPSRDLDSFPWRVISKSHLPQVPNMTLDESDGEIRGSVTNEQGEVCQLPWEKGGEVHFGLI